MKKYKLKDSHVKGYKYICFDSIESFYYSTREERIDKLIEDLFKCIKYSKGVNPEYNEYDSWKYSLPDFARLLYEPDVYHKELPDIAEKHKETAEELFTGVLERINEHLEAEDGYSKYTKKHIYQMIEASLNSRLEDYKKNIKTDRYKTITFDLDLEIMIEFPLLEKKNSSKPCRCDVILHHKKPDGSGKYVIIELKQYTEGFEPNENQDRPWTQVAKYIKLYNEKFNAKATGLVYLHNQMYYDGKLFKELGNEEASKGIMYTRGCCGSFINKLKRVFK